jgi:hypothetical protein
MMTTVNTTTAALLRSAVTTVLLAATAVVVAWQVLFTGPDMGVNRYVPVRVSNTGIGGPAVQTGFLQDARVWGTQRVPSPTGAHHAQ